MINKVRSLKYQRLKSFEKCLHETFKGLIKKKTIIKGVYNFYEYNHILFQYSEKRNDLWCSPFVFSRLGQYEPSYEKNSTLILEYFNSYYNIHGITITPEKHYGV